LTADRRVHDQGAVRTVRITLGKERTMGFLDTVKSKLTGAVNSQGEKIADGLDKAGDVVDDKTGGKFGDKIDTGVDKAKDALDGLDGKDDDIA
jgi:hypothetical protein